MQKEDEPRPKKAPVYRIVLTGGPCAGKTTALSLLQDRLRGAGYRVFLVPEVATIMLMGGVKLGDFSTQHIVRFQSNIIKVQMAVEDAFLDLTRSTHEPAVVICDRGVMDSKAYVPSEVWDALLDESGWNVVSLRDRRYDGIVHIVTAAIGADSFYSSQSNAARFETAETAKALDLRLREAWTGHPRLRIIDNSTDFNTKCQRVVAAVFALCGITSPRLSQRNYLVIPPSMTDLTSLPVTRVEQFDIEDRYLLTSDGSETKVRRRGQNSSWVYTHSTRGLGHDGQSVEERRQISGREYVNLLASIDPSRPVVKKRRATFLYKDSQYIVDTFVDPPGDLSVLRVAAESPNQQIPIPPPLRVIKDVTGTDVWAAEQIPVLLRS